MKKTLWMAVAFLVLLAMPLTSCAEAENSATTTATSMYVKTMYGGRVNLRVGPSTNDRILISIAYGEEVTLLKTSSNGAWAKIEYGTYGGYMSLRHLSATRPGPYQRPKPINPAPSGGSTEKRLLSELFTGFELGYAEMIVVPSTPSTYVNLRWAPSMSSPVRAQYWAGGMLQVLSRNGNWSEVHDAANGLHGYMVSSFLMTFQL